MCRVRTRSKREASSQNLTWKTSHMLNIPYNFLNGFELISKMTRGTSQSAEIRRLAEKSHVWMGAEADRVFAQFRLDRNEDKNDFWQSSQDVWWPFYVIHERATFHRRDQKPGETVEQYIRCLYELAEHADFSEKEETIRDRIVLGLLDKELSEKLQLQEGLTLRQVTVMARQHECVKQELAMQWSGACASISSVDRHKNKSSSSKLKGEKRESSSTCGRCGLTHDKGKCPAKGKTCHKCGKSSHFAKVCRSKPAGKMINRVEAKEPKAEEESKQTFFIGSVASAGDPWRVKLSVEGTVIDFKIDTGTDVNMIGRSTWQSLGQPELSENRGVTLHSPGGVIKHLESFRLLSMNDYPSKSSLQTITWTVCWAETQRQHWVWWRELTPQLSAR